MLFMFPRKHVSYNWFSFGYDTGQISGFLEMPDFLNRFAQKGPDGPAFSTVRSGLIVGMVSLQMIIGQGYEF